MNLKNLTLILYLIFSSIVLSQVVFSETINEKSQRYQDYRDTTYNIFMILIGIFLLLCVITMMLIINHFGIKHLINYLAIAFLFGGIIIITILLKILN